MSEKKDRYKGKPCETCQNTGMPKLLIQDGHCYMFHKYPGAQCSQHKKEEVAIRSNT